MELALALTRSNVDNRRTAKTALRRGGRVVECGGLESRDDDEET